MQCERPRHNQWHKDNPARSKGLRKKWGSENVAHISQYNKRRREEHPEILAASFRAWADKNRPKLAAKQRAREVTRMGAMPAWLDDTYKAQIEEIYETAALRSKETGIKYHVDHIFPLDGKIVSGLHVPWNLQILEATKNAAKKNRIPKEFSHLFWSAGVP